MKLKNFYKIEYICNVDAGTVTAVAKINKLDKNFLQLRNYYSYITGDYSKSRLVFSGVARLKAGDEVDVKLAKRIARCKALRQANNYFGILLFKMTREIKDRTLQMELMGIDAFSKAEGYNKEIIDTTRGE